MSEKMFHNEIIAAAFQTMIESTKDMVFIKDANLRYVEASMSFAQMAGKKSPEEIIGKTDTEIFEPTLAKRYISDDDGGLAGILSYRCIIGFEKYSCIDESISQSAM
jgi:PAS domain-containing protein